MARTTIVLSDDLQEKAKQLEINVSAACREAVERAIEAKEEIRKWGSDFERVVAWRPRPYELGERGEQVSFRARLVFADQWRDIAYYVTQGGGAAIVDENGILWHSENLDDLGITDGFIKQAMSEALGQVVEPTPLDI